MNKKPKNIEQLFSESFNDFRVEPSSGLWKKISSKLAWRNFFTFTTTTLNAYYVAGILTLATAGALLLTKPAIENNPETQEITINKANENAVITPIQENEVESKEVIIPEKSRKQEIKSQKPVPGTQDAASSTIVVTKADTQKLSSSAIVKTKTENQESISSIKHISPSTQNPEPSTHELATPHPKPKTQNPPSSSVVLTKEDNQKPETSNQSPDPWPKIDSLFTNQTPTPPQHTIQFPNAFTPNANGPTNGYYTPGLLNNDVFHPEYKGVVEYHLSIFNRRGELIFESKEINVGWDGYINDRLAAQGVYIWKAHGRFSNGQSFTKVGNIMLIKR